MRSLFHFPFPAQPPSQQPSPTATVSLQSEMRYRPHPAPMRRQRRSPVLLSAARPLPGPALTGPWPTVTRSQGARHTAPPSLPHAAARAHRAPSPEYRPAAARSHWARLVRIAPTACRRPHRIYPTACRHPHPPMSPPSRFRAHRPPHHDHRVPPPSYTCCASPSASRPPCADIRVTLSRCVGPGALAGKNRTVCILFRRMREKGPLPGNIRPKCMLFEIKMATSSPHASIPGRNRAIQDAWRANLAAKAPFSRRGTRNHAWREDVASAARPFRGSGMRHAAWPNGLCALRQRHAARGMAERALRPAARAWPACRMRPSLPSRLCPPRPAPPAISPAFIAAVLHAPCFAVRDPPRGPRTDVSRHLRAAPIPPAARTHCVQETSGTTQTTQCGHKNRIPK